MDGAPSRGVDHHHHRSAPSIFTTPMIGSISIPVLTYTKEVLIITPAEFPLPVATKAANQWTWSACGTQFEVFSRPTDWPRTLYKQIVSRLRHTRF